MMQRSFIMWNITDLNDMLAMERYYPLIHAPEVLARQPTITRYVSYRALPSPPKAEEFGYYNYRLTESLKIQEAGPPAPSGLFSMKGTPSATPGGARRETMQSIWAAVPFYATDDFMGSELLPREKTILRWFIIFKYPDGVPVEEGEKWFLEIHSKEVMKQPGLTRYFSWRVPKPESPVPGWGVPKPGQLPRYAHRVVEQWYENYDGWIKSVIQSPPKYTKPAWAEYDKYPFLEPYVNFVSTFITERPDMDFLRDLRPYYI
jgi:hypothetical protein